MHQHALVSTNIGSKHNYFIRKPIPCNGSINLPYPRKERCAAKTVESPRKNKTRRKINMKGRQGQKKRTGKVSWRASIIAGVRVDLCYPTRAGYGVGYC